MQVDWPSYGHYNIQAHRSRFQTILVWRSDRATNPTSLAKFAMALIRHRCWNKLLLAHPIWIIVAELAIAWSLSVTGQWATAGAPDQPISFVNDIMPVLTKAGCNSGVCHAKAGGGQNGFELSLLGFEPSEDFNHLTREGRGRRLFPAAPDQSLLLQKISGRLAHGGGIRLDPQSTGYQLIRRWIDQSTPDTSAIDPLLESLAVEPSRGQLPMQGQQQLKAIAHYGDGNQRDVTESGAV